MGPYPQAYEIARYLDFIENISLQTLHSTSKDLLDGQEDIESIEAEIDSKLAHIDSCLADLNFEKDKLEKALLQINELNPEALDSDKGVIDTKEPIHGQIVMCFAQG